MNTAQKPLEEMTRDERIMAWNDAKKALDRAKDAEMKLRKSIVDGEFDVSTVGTQNIELGNGWKLKAVVKESYKLSTDNDKVDAVLDTLEDWQADRLVKWSGRLMKSEYDKLDEADKGKVNAVLTIAPSAPTLELIAPKGA